ncbi:MAG: mitochondrial fission ELM1 family protein [Parvibaculales bacterium]
MTDISLSCIWTLTNGMAGFEVQTSAVASHIAGYCGLDDNAVSRKTVCLSAPYKWLAPYGPAQKQASCTPPYPDLLIASGRKSIPLARHIKKASGGSCYTVILQNPRISPRHFDFVWAPAHDRLRGKNVFSTLLSPHGLTQESLLQAASDWAGKIKASAKQKRIGVLVGGPNKIYGFKDQDVRNLAQAVKHLAEAGHFIMLSLSRRTPDGVEARLAEALSGHNHFLWAPRHGGDNPYRGILGLADAMLVTCDSVNMVGEACTTGVPVYILKLDGGSHRFDRFHRAVCETGHAAFMTQEALAGLCTGPFPDPMKTGLNSTAEIAGKIIDDLRKSSQNSL